ncbi:hypothetical protein EVJ58_g6064 [Rhodofomes roseus]|uniref:CxC2-like cysteine cluster KDZ transposase-associated domain-containing protein n=1 Tax=Rhodofomes roseus TaxID=34475 RepID=A0A4Y9YAB7_9APHY|nr:hypothetical protein EVJ58_g6064 [Rhodofomes roseus]
MPRRRSKFKRIWTAFLAAMPRKWRRCNYDVHVVPDDDDDGDPASTAAPLTEKTRHVDYVSAPTGLSSQTSFYSLPSSPNPSSTSLPELVPDELDYLDNIDEANQPSGPNYQFTAEDAAEAERRRQRRTASDHPLHEWAADIDTWLLELLRLEGRGEHTGDACPTCLDGLAEYRCADCADLQLYCGACTVESHSHNPWHRLTVWVKSHFRRTTLKNLGLRIQLGHPPGERCPNPKAAFNDDFVILDTTGIHRVALDFCDCTQKQQLPVQLMRARLFPATVTNPKTAATYRLMEHFHLLRTQSKISAHEFYQCLARQTENVEPQESADRYSALLRMTREWSHLKMLKRAGRGHDPTGAAGTLPGECAVECPTCPQPEKNLPSDWKTAPKGKSWLYRLFVGLDANFCLKRKKVSTNQVDPGLNKGYAYFVEDTKYKAFLEQFDDLPPEANTCHKHDAIKLANIKKVRETDTSGVGTVECTWHDMKRPRSVADLQVGERYVNMDYIFFSSLSHHAAQEIIASYDISCQWSRNLWSRLTAYGLPFDPADHRFRFLIPKFHLPAHQSSCQTGYSFNFTAGVGRTDGEAVERGWAAVNPFASSTKEMGPGHRHNVLDDVFGDYNWRKVRQMGPALLARLKEAVPNANEHQVAFEEFTEVLPLRNIATWTEMVTKWEDDPSNPNPFVATEPKVTMAAVRRELAEEEAARLEAGTLVACHDNMSPAIMITAGLELKDLQECARSETKKIGSHSTDKQRTDLLERANTLRRKIEAWFKIQQTYIPGVEALRARKLQVVKDPTVYDLPLLLPSAIQGSLSVDPSLMECEWRLRHAQAHDSLNNLRQHLRLSSHLYHFKDRFTRGQRENIRKPCNF